MVVYVANASPQDACKYRGTLFVTTDKINSKGKMIQTKNTVYLNVNYKNDEVDSINDWLDMGSYCKSTVFVTTEYGFTFPKILTTTPDLTIYHRVPLSAFSEDVVSSTPESVIILVDVSEDIDRDLRKYVEICSLSERIRIIGGELLKVPGLRIGYTESGTLKGTSEKTENFVYPNDLGSYDNFIVTNLSDLTDVQEVPVKQKVRALGKPKIAKPVKAVKKSEPKPKKLSKSAITSSFLQSEEVSF